MFKKIISMQWPFFKLWGDDMKRMISFILASTTAFSVNLGYAFAASTNPEKDYEYFLSLSDDEVLQQYKEYRESIGDPIPEISYKDNGVVINDIVSLLNCWIAYGSISNNTVEAWPSTLIDDRYDEVNTQPAEYFGFPSNDTIGCTINIPLIRIDNYTMQLAGEKEDAYDVMRYVLTVANSEFWEDNYEGEEGAGVEVSHVLGASDILTGDANGDAAVDLCDAVAILQFLALPQKYPMQEFLVGAADCDGIEGLSGGDALWIQQKDAGLS